VQSARKREAYRCARPVNASTERASRIPAGTRLAKVNDASAPHLEEIMNRSKQPKPQSASRDNRAEQRHQKGSQVAQLSAANVEESPHMDRGDSEGGAGQSLPGGDDRRAGQSHERGAIDTQYGTSSSTKTRDSKPASSGATGAADDSVRESAKPGPAEESPGSERDTMSGPRPGSSN
jgi:hypothetical protein